MTTQRKGNVYVGWLNFSTGEHLPQSKAFVHSWLWGLDAFLIMDKTVRNVSLNGSRCHPTTFPVIVCEGNDFVQTRRLGMGIFVVCLKTDLGLLRLVSVRPASRWSQKMVLVKF